MEINIIIKKIIEETKQTQAQVEALILEKQEELSNLVSKEGAAYIIARELGINLFEQKKINLQVKNIVPGARSLTFEARIVNIFPAKEFEFKGKKSKVGNIILGDQTGTIRMSLWDDQTNILDSVSQGMPVEVFGAYSKEDNKGLPEIRLSRQGGLKILETTEIPEIKPAEMRENRVDIPDLKEGAFSEVKAVLVQVFDTNNFYAVCSKCGKKVQKSGADFVCAEHSKTDPKYQMVFSGVIDDGYGNIRAVFFREAALSAVKMDVEKAMEGKKEIFNNVLGKEFVLAGTVRNNKMFDRLEFVVNRVSEVDAKKEAEILISKMER